MASLNTLLIQFQHSAHRLPTTSEGLTALMFRPADIPEANWRGPFIDGIPKDGWRHPFNYTLSQDGKGFTLASPGRDRQFGTVDDVILKGPAAPDSVKPMK